MSSSPENLKGLQNKSITAISYYTLFRQSEIVALFAGVITKLKDRTAEILIRRSKNDPHGEDHLGFISSTTLKLLEQLLQWAKMKQGYIIRSISIETVSDKALHPHTINKIIK